MKNCPLCNGKLERFDLTAWNAFLGNVLKCKPCYRFWSDGEGGWRLITVEELRSYHADYAMTQSIKFAFDRGGI